MASVRFSSGTNSTFFTTCCGSAICDDQECCPSCGEQVTPLSHRGRWDSAMQSFYGRDKVREMRKGYALKAAGEKI